MAVRIRLKRVGKIHHPIYRVMMVDSRKKRNGRVIEEVGEHDPNQEPSLIELEPERIQYWLGVGAQPSDVVHRFLVLSGDWAKFKGAKNAENRIRTKDEGDDAAAAIKVANDVAEKAKAKRAEAEAKAKREAKAAKAAAEPEKTAEEAPAEEAPAEEKAE